MNTVAKKWVLGFSSLVLLGLSQLALADAREVVNESFAVASNEKIYIEVMSGDVTIKTGSDKQFKVSGKLDEKATGYLLDTKEGFTRFEMTMPRQVNYNWKEKANTAELTFEVPAGSSVEFKGVNSDVSISGVTGGSQIHTVNGKISAKDLTTQVELTTVNGEIVSTGNSGRIMFNSVNGEITDNGSGGRIDYSVVNGTVNVTSSAEEVSLSSVNGEAKVKLNGTQRFTLSTVNGEISAEVTNSASPRISGSSVSGEISLKLDSNTNARVDIKTSAGGDIDNKLTSDKPNKAKYGPARSLQFTLGNGDGSIELTTVSGDIELDKL